MSSTASTVASMIAGLREAGTPVAEISKACGCGRITIWRLSNGEVQRPAYDVVTKLAAFHAARMGKVERR